MAGSAIHRILGYDLKQIFIGAEGTLGIVTGVSILAPVMPAATNAVILALSNFDKVVPLYKTVKQDMGEILSAFEYMDRNAYTLSVKHGQGKRLSEEETEGAQCFILIETSGGNKEHDEEVCPSLILPPRLSHRDPLLETVQPIRKGDGPRHRSSDVRGSGSVPYSVRFSVGNQRRNTRGRWKSG